MQKTIVNSGLKILELMFLLAAGMYLASCTTDSQTVSNNITFKSKLSGYALFKSEMADLNPAARVERIAIASPLFTDYAEKQRLIKIPAGTKISSSGNGLPIFPEGTIIAKTFFYSKSQNEKRQIIETRLLILANKKWNAASYQWNADQTDANLLTDGAIVPVFFEDYRGKHRNVKYKIPAQNDCSSCHRSGNELVPIGPKMQNLNVMVEADGNRQNQLDYLIKKGIFEHEDIAAIASLPDYKNTSLALNARARAYLEMNCAHCHQVSGTASNTSLNLSYNTPFEKTGIDFNKQNILIRMSTMGEYHMPKTGTTTLDDEGVQLIRDYITSLGSKQTQPKK